MKLFIMTVPKVGIIIYILSYSEGLFPTGMQVKSINIVKSVMVPLVVRHEIKY